MAEARRARTWPDIVQGTLDGMLRVLENPTRRKILERLARESHYPLQLSKELGVSQQAVVKHLKALEDSGLVASVEEKSDLGGPARRAYTATHSVSLRIDVGRSLFRAEMRPLDDPAEKVEGYAWAEDALARAREEKDVRRRVRRLAEGVQRLNGEIEALDRKRAYLVRLKDAALREVHGDVEDVLRSYDERQVLYCLVEEGGRDLDEIAESLDLREKVVQELVRRIEREFAIDWSG